MIWTTAITHAQRTTRGRLRGGRASVHAGICVGHPRCVRSMECRRAGAARRIGIARKYGVSRGVACCAWLVEWPRYRRTVNRLMRAAAASEAPAVNCLSALVQSERKYCTHTRVQTLHLALCPPRQGIFCPRHQEPRLPNRLLRV